MQKFENSLQFLII